MKACVVFATHFGNTERIAKAFAAGLADARIETTCVNANRTAPASLEGFDLLCVGAPTEAFSAYLPMKDFLTALRGSRLSGVLGFAFDTKLDSRLSGSAAKFIEKRLEEMGLRIIAPRESAIVFGPKPSKLRDGEEERFRQIGARVGATAIAATPTAVTS